MKHKAEEILSSLVVSMVDC